MLAQIEPARGDFMALARYLIHGKERPTHPDRVAWILTRNLPTDDPEIAAIMMAATAERSKRCKEPCYHISINWHPDEQPTPGMMQEIAVRALELAELAEHQAFIIGHGDKAHRHLHMMINRVHPDTGRAWSTSHDYKRFDAIMRQLADEYGFAHVPSHTFNPVETADLPRKPNSAATYAARRGAKTSRPQWSARDATEYAARLSEHLDAASSWEDMEALLAEDGLTLEAKGPGHVVGDAASYVKLSALGLQKTAKGFTKRRAPARKPRRSPSPQPSGRHWWDVDAVDIARAIGTREELRAAVQAMVGRRKAWRAGKPVMDQLMEELEEQLKAATSLTAPKSRSKQRRQASLARSRGPQR